MRRILLCCSVALILPACGGADRLEGKVERWLLALNQASAGEPGRYAVPAVSEEILQDWRTLDPGALDVIEVGKGSDGCDVFIACETRVPFRVVRQDGTEVRLDAIIPSDAGPPRGAQRLIVELAPADSKLRLPSEGGPSIGDERAGPWGIAIGVGIALVIMGEAVMRLARRRRPD